MIWYDVTEIKNWQGHHTGIQRVIAKIGECIKGSEDIGFCYYDPLINGFRVYEFDFNAEVQYLPQNSSAKFTMEQKVQKTVAKLKSKASPRLKNTIKRVVAVRGVGHDTVDFRASDVLFIPGAFWIYSFDHLAELKASRGVKLVGIMYDLVPLVTPQFTAQVTIAGFDERFIRALNLFDHWFAISENTKKDMISEARQREVRFESTKVDVIRLGVEDPKLANEEGKLQKVSGLKSNGFALFVSTIEARKNQMLVYQAVKRIQELSASHLPIVLVGKYGWLSDDIVYILKNDKSIEGKLLWLDRVDDRSLRWLYANCAFTVYPSYYEGWGLPVAESLALGKPCIASSASSIPEVAGDLIEYFSPYSSDELSELLIKYSDKRYIYKRTKIVGKFIAPTWQSCSQQVLEKLRSL